jgi:hypothetical protein
VTKIVNNHTMKFGFTFRRAGQNDYDQINVQGVPGGTTNQNRASNAPVRRLRVAMGDAALGLFHSYARSVSFLHASAATCMVVRAG